MAHWGAKLHWEGATIPRSSACTGQCSVGWVQKWLRSGATLLRMAKAWVRTKTEFGKGREKDRKHRHEHPREAQS